MEDEDLEDAHDQQRLVEHLRRKRGPDLGDFVIYGGWFLWVLTVALWFIAVVR